MTTARFLCLLAAVLRGVVCLTEQEVSNFKHSGLNGGYVSVTASSVRETYIISASGLPDHEIGNVNPNRAEDKKFRVEIPRNPEHSTTPGCLPKGPIGFTVSGVAIFNPLNSESENAVEGSGEERFDQCDGHADRSKVYHYHKLPDSCAYSSNTDEMVGVALDGFPIYGPHVSDLPRLLTPADLDRCNGRYFNGTYRYHATKSFPYFIGCFKGNADTAMNQLRKTIKYTCGSKSAYTKWGYMCSCTDPIALTPDEATNVTTDASTHSRPLSTPASPPPRSTEDSSPKPSGSPPPMTTGIQFPKSTCYPECDPSKSTKMECGVLLLTVVMAVANVLTKNSLS